MKKILSLFAVMAFISMGQSAFAWTYDGLGSLNPFTNFGRGFGNSDCGCVKPKLSKCERLKLKRGAPTGYAVPVIRYQACPEKMPVIIEDMPIYGKKIYYMKTPCTNCHKVF